MDYYEMISGLIKNFHKQGHKLALWNSKFQENKQQDGNCNIYTSCINIYISVSAATSFAPPNSNLLE